MDKIKIFYGYWDEVDVDEDEVDQIKSTQKEINKWLEKNPNIRVKNMLQTYWDEEYILTVHYTTDIDPLLP